MENVKSRSAQAAAAKDERRRRFRGTVLTGPEGRVLIAGTVLTLLYTIWVAAQLILSVDRFQTLLGMTAMEIVFGRVACMAFGYSLGMSHAEVVLVSMILETILVLIFYPLFVFIWRQLLVVKWLKRISDRIRITAERHKDKVQKYGIVGLFMFVWLPFWMTGPVVGCMIGYLLRLRVWVNITTVLIGTYAAIGGWAFLLHQLHQKTVSYSSYAIVILTGLIAAVMLGWTLRQRFRRKNSNNSDV